MCVGVCMRATVFVRKHVCACVCVAAGAEHEGSFYHSRGLVCVPTVRGLMSTITA